MEIKVEKSSWHYRYYKWLAEKFRGPDFTWSDPQSVCPYFWGFVLNNLWALFISAIAVLLVSAATFILTSLVWAPIAIFGFGVMLEAVLIPLCLGCAAWLLIAALFISEYYKDNKNRIHKSISETTDKGFMGVTKGAFWAFKNKVCPRIIYVEEKKGEKSVL